MAYHERIEALAGDAEQLEQVFQEAQRAGEGSDFQRAIEARYAAQPENLLYAAWFHRLRHAAVQAKEFAVSWAWVLPLAVANGLLFWWLSDEQFMIRIRGYLSYDEAFLPLLLLAAAPLTAAFVLAYLAGAGQRHRRLAAWCGGALFAAAIYTFLIYPRLGTIPFQEQYLSLAAIHLPLLAWAGVGLYLTNGRRDAQNRFAFLLNSLEVFVVGGLFALAGGVFAAITIALFDALDVELPETVMRLIFAGGLGFLAVIAVAIVYNPALPPARQAFNEGLGKLVSLLPRLLLPLALLVLAVYLVFIAFNFRAPFDNREVLITYNVMLFAVVALLVGATPLSESGVPPRLRRWLRRGLVALAFLSLLVGLYALAAMVYRTAQDRLTPNRLTFIGWNMVNIGLLAYLLWRQARVSSHRWVAALQQTFAAGTVAYTAWTLIVLLALPWLFGIDQGEIAALPPSVQEIVYEQPNPVLLKCSASPHIYLLEDGQKRWIDSIETFNGRGYVWRDVQFVPCEDLRQVSDGTPIPADAGPPPQP